MEEITQEQRKQALATITVTLVDGMFDKNDKWISEEVIFEDVMGYAVKDECLFVLRAGNITTVIPIREIEKFERKENQ